MNQYYAIELLSSDVAGGSTRPWKIRAEREGGEVVEVAVKLFNQKDLDQYQPVAKELFGHHLASHFGLAVPDFGLIELGDHFVSTLPEKERTRLAGTHAGKKFASEWVPNAPLLDVAHLNQTMYAKYEIPLVYAFDHFIWNNDRSLSKPNLLISEYEFFLIDHEMCFPFESLDYLQGLGIGKYGYPSSNHVFYAHLKAKRTMTKKTLFDEFCEYLHRFKMSSLEELQGFMVKNEVLCLTDDLILTHIRTLQSRPTQFVQLLLQSLA